MADVGEDPSGRRDHERPSLPPEDVTTPMPRIGPTGPPPPGAPPESDLGEGEQTLTFLRQPSAGPFRQEGPRLPEPPRRQQEAPRFAQEAPRFTQEPPRPAQEAPRFAQELPRFPQGSSRFAQEEPPRFAQEPPQFERKASWAEREAPWLKRGPVPAPSPERPAGARGPRGRGVADRLMQRIGDVPIRVVYGVGGTLVTVVIVFLIFLVFSGDQPA
ncbi:hypothetical protein [Streptosporangium sp. KLBMP 9127]|nr:hypothetical protein [Streptosporangium sp. KLBMP 9127]